MNVRQATVREYPAARAILEAAMLELSIGALRHGVALIAVEDDRILGTLLLDGHEIAAIAVRPGRRGQGIGTTLVAAAARYRPVLIACFDRRIRPFYEALGFEIECDRDRCHGRLRTVG